MVQIMLEVFGDRLVRASAGEEVETFTSLPSPEELKGKILLKVRVYDLTLMSV